MYQSCQPIPKGTFSLKDVLAVIYQQNESFAEFQCKVSTELSAIKQEVHGSASQVKKLNWTLWSNGGSRVFVFSSLSSFNSELCENLDQVEWAIANGKHDYAKETVSSVSYKQNGEIS